MKLNILPNAVSLLGMLCLAGAANGALVSYTQGDLLVGFRATSGVGANTNYVVNLGSAADVRDGTLSGTISLGDLNTDLTAIYGADWATRDDLYWGIAGSPSNVVTVNGDASKTVYVSVANGGPADGPLIGNSLRTTVSTKMTGMEQGTVGFSSYQASANNSRAAIQSASDASSWSSYMNGGSNGGAIDFGAFSEIEGHVYDSLSVYRLTSPTSSTLEGTFTLSSGGAISAVPEPTSALLAGLGVAVAGFRRRRSA
ncbi:PEP-CTERM sorting domain-containing protein [Luteolibacter sp. LG18]|uniref:PEP-CTERM sorting domain-containing protein n=1 Tax=Luteolibacter sp. LG18 TaxID=2819286 RepID=UPI002B3237D9|nr:hypothetical protein llg_00230 [Luteolibacter sp. LG18]